MAETNKAGDADAVLSSVRRIIESGPPGARTSMDEANDEALGSEKLLLTPSLRVDGPKTTRESPTFFHSPRRFTTLEHRIAELEQAVSSRSDSWEPDGSELDDNETPKTFVFAHDPRPYETLGRDESDPATDEDDASLVLGADQRVAISDASDCTPTHPSDADMGPRHAPIMRDIGGTDADIDDDALRELISHLVRAELQGELGEKITRNVRKLVRREIHRVLLTHDFG